MIKNFIPKNFTPNVIRGEGQTNIEIIFFQCEGGSAGDCIYWAKFSCHKADPAIESLSYKALHVF